MGHFDYDCCAACNGKQSYNDDNRVKEEVCSYCAVELAKAGVFVHDVGELIDWMETADPKVVVATLDAAGFEKCFSPNKVDSLYTAAKAKVA